MMPLIVIGAYYKHKRNWYQTIAASSLIRISTEEGSGRISDTLEQRPFG